MKWLLFIIISFLSCTPQKPNAIRQVPPKTEFDKKDGRIKARDKFDNRDRVEYFNEIQHK